MSTQKLYESTPSNKNYPTREKHQTETPKNHSSTEEKTPSEKKNYFLTTIKNTSNFVLISLITKVLNLVINIFVIRKVTKQTFGIAKIYFESAYLMLQYFPLETMRKTTQKYCCSVEREDMENLRFEQCSRIMWLLNFIFMLITIPVWFLYVNYGENLSDVGFQMFLHLFSSNIELYVEPIMLYCNIKFLNNYRLILNTLGNYTRVFTTFVLVIFFDMELWGFTLARLLSSSVYVIYAIYINYRDLKLSTSAIFPFVSGLGLGPHKKKDEKESEFYTKRDTYVPKKEENFGQKFIDYFFISNYANLFNPLLKEIFMSFVYINLLKMILTYTEKIFLSFFIRFAETEKSEYSFVTDNFAILIRFFLEPLETNFFNLINKIKAPAEEIDVDSTENEKNKNSDEKIENKEEGATENEDPFKEKLREYNQKKKKTVEKMMNILNLFLRFLLIFGFLLVGYIYTIGKDVFSLVFGSSWVTDSAIVILRNYSIYIFIISINGVVEAFCNAIANNRQMKLFNKMMIINSICLISFSVLLNGYSVLGLIYANGLAMLLRILGNVYIIFSTEATRTEINLGSSEKDANKQSYFAAQTETAKRTYNEFDILRSLNDKDNYSKNNGNCQNNQENLILQIARLFNNCLFTVRTFVVYVISVSLVYRISQFNYFDDNNFRLLVIVNNNFIKVALAGVVFLGNVFMIYLFEKADFKRIYNDSV